MEIFPFKWDSLDIAGVLVANKEESPARELQVQPCILCTSPETSLKAVLTPLSKVMTPIHFFFYLTEFMLMFLFLEIVRMLLL